MRVTFLERLFEVSGRLDVAPLRSIIYWKRFGGTATSPVRIAFTRVPYRLGGLEVGIGSGSTAPIDVFHTDRRTRIRIGKYCSIGRNVKFIGVQHHVPERVTTSILPVVLHEYLPPKSTPERGVALGDIQIGNDVWIGDDVTIMGGSVVEDGAVVGTKSLVTTSSRLRAYGIFGGVPAREIRMRFEPELVSSLVTARWWDLPPEVIGANLELFRREASAASLADIRRLSETVLRGPHSTPPKGPAR